MSLARQLSFVDKMGRRQPPLERQADDYGPATLPIFKTISVIGQYASRLLAFIHIRPRLMPCACYRMRCSRAIPPTHALIYEFISHAVKAIVDYRYDANNMPWVGEFLSNGVRAFHVDF